MGLKRSIKNNLGRLAETYRVARFMFQPSMWKMLKGMEGVKRVHDTKLSNLVEIPNVWAKDGDGLKAYLMATQCHIYLVLKRPGTVHYARAVLDEELGTFINNVYLNEISTWDLKQNSFDQIIEKIKLRVDSKLQYLADDIGRVEL